MPGGQSWATGFFVKSYFLGENTMKRRLLTILTIAVVLLVGGMSAAPEFGGTEPVPVCYPTPCPPSRV